MNGNVKKHFSGKQQTGINKIHLKSLNIFFSVLHLFRCHENMEMLHFENLDSEYDTLPCIFQRSPTSPPPQLIFLFLLYQSKMQAVYFIRVEITVFIPLLAKMHFNVLKFG